MRGRMVLHYQTDQTGQNVLLEGVNENNDTIHVVLKRWEKKYLLPESIWEAGNTTDYSCARRLPSAVDMSLCGSLRFCLCGINSFE